MSYFVYSPTPAATLSSLSEVKESFMNGLSTDSLDLCSILATLVLLESAHSAIIMANIQTVITQLAIGTLPPGHPVIVDIFKPIKFAIIVSSHLATRYSEILVQLAEAFSEALPIATMNLNI